MTPCRFYQQGYCKFGNSCRFEHVNAGSRSQPTGNRFAPLGTGGGAGQELPNKYHVTPDVIEKDLTTEVPEWILSAYAPGRDAPEQLFGGYPREQSFEELRLHFWLGQASGNEQAALNEAQQLWQTAKQQMDNAARNPHEAAKFVIEGEGRHPNRHDVCKEGTQGAPFGEFAVGRNALQPASATGAFGQTSQLGPRPNPFAQASQASQGPSAFGQPSQPGPSSAFGQPSSLGAKPSPFGAPAFGQPSQPAGQGSFGQASAFGQPSQLGQASPFAASASPFASAGASTAASTNPFATAAPASNAFAQQSPFGQQQQQQQQQQQNPFAQPAPDSPFASNQAPANPFGQPSAGGSTFGQQQPQQQQQQQTMANHTGTGDSPYAPTSSRQHPPLGSYSSKDMTGRLATFKGKPVTYKDGRPGVRSFDGTWTKIWFPEGPPGYNGDTEVAAGQYDEESKARWARFAQTGAFADGVMPELPPPRDVTRWDF